MSTPAYSNLANLVLPNPQVQPLRNQQNFGQICGTIMSQNPDIDISDVQTEVNNIVRKIYDRREWYGLMIRGQVATTGFTVGGSINATQGSPLIQGTGTTWTPGLVGQQFRLGFNTPPYTILSVDPFAQTLQLEMPWASSSFSSAGYFIAQYYYALGPTIRYIHTAKNMIQAWRLWLNYNQQTLDALDPWRATVFTPVALVQMPPDPNGNYMVELWPVPSIVQALPFIAMIQPPNLVSDQDTLPVGMRTDIITKFGVAWAKTYRGPKTNKYYDKAEADRLRGEAEREIQYMAKTDEDLYRQNIIYPGEDMAPTVESVAGRRGAIYDINHAVPAGESVWSGW